MAGMLNIGMTGLNAAQAQLATTSHNITNVNTAGYHRQTVGQGALEPLFTGAGFFGQGTRVSSVTRSYDQFLESQVLQADNRRSQYAAYGAQIGQINNLLADSTTGLSPAMANFFAGVQEVASNPTSPAARQALISNAQSLATRFHSLNARMEEIREGVEGSLVQTVESINSYAKAIAEMNQRIVVAQAGGAGTPANDLLDQRDLLLGELNKLVKITVVEESDGANASGAVSVFIGSGQSLVLRGAVSTFEVIPSASDPERGAVSMVAPGGNRIELAESLLTGGTLGGLLEFRRVSLDAAQNELGLIALGITETFNAQHKLGIDLEGVFGKNFFKPITPTVVPATAGVATSITDVSEVRAKDYRVAVDNIGGTVKLFAGDEEVASQALPATWPVTLEGGGLSVTVPSAASIPEKGLLIQPTRDAASHISVAITDYREIAAGGPVSVSAPLVNQGTGKLADIDVRSIAGMDGAGDGKPDFASFSASFSGTSLSVPAGYTIERLRQDATSGQWVADTAYPSGSATTFDPATDSSGAQFRITGPGGYAFDFKFSGSPESGDSFEFASNAAGVADNRNAVALGALQTSKVMLADGSGRPTATFQSIYAQTVTTVGNKTREVQVNESAQQALLDQATASRDSVSGVNLDEEAANLVRFQLAYQASARVMTVAQRLFDELIAIGR
ncbi:flagellar hook-associated protein FlgK [Thauera linaloolentis]|uniref:Flagellar hook-associated protein 1 n=1 Tax=Thauera linaloolentis (strain DSM 12138 / JCM 21573 / CCUG 41526 / CIP 105981 / IAM 15112 / NBRC 102519 / 47Lol) TaxID=1123367 RepID=N6YDB9_THAL4|nr:flagellar hook-associated protein FlgK [Thauera linaloolentis]ENO89530.1 flagellar hook-filament junction protein 1 [Thauera linaloolentis 47Lol = DSM 12138]MCM8565425.1 flagellar hook-associated protein FlgK [Thauera linaloolentis]